MDIHYIGEHLLPGILGKLFIWVSFSAAIFSTVLFYLNSRKKQEGLNSLRPYARGFFILHTGLLLLVGFILYYLIFFHYFEYAYVWQYSSTELPIKYIISCFWAGQEGSLLVWAIFQSLLGIILLFIAKKWEDGVMSVVSLSQVFITSMMLGIHLGAIKIGGSPFTLIRETVINLNGTIFQQPDYLRLLGDGNGLNPLLENIWMTIHPPILFLGYALALVPFAYAIASLIKQDFFSWIKPALPWTILSMTFLGAGILLGGAWAYVSLTFGGFWSWDPVENSSLVPWLTLIAGLHFLLIARKQNYSLLMAYVFIGLSYVLVLYASFLTRSGVLANSSAHSFGDNGMTAQLLAFLLLFLVLMIVLIVYNVRKFYEKKEEILLSREFWMFVGAIVIVLAAFQILFATSVPVFNSLFGTNIAPPADRVGFYNKWQLPYALLVSGFIAFSQFLYYHINSTKEFLRKIIVPAVLSIVILVPFLYFGIIRQVNYIMLVFFVIFALVSSLYNLIFTTSKPRNIPAILTHIGFIVFLLGTVMTFSNSKTISSNTSPYDLGDTKSNAENLMMVKGDTLYMGGFFVVYTNNVKKGNLTEYRVDFLKRKTGKYIKEFSLFPSVNKNPRMGNVYNPDTKHFLWMDYYTYISLVGAEPDYIVIKAIINPWINILWLGAILIIGGSSFAFYRRVRQRKFSNT
jgi:cytochrome c-type biogenesis protein CcmF